ncbi:MAG: hypothetical protein AAFY38_00205 [Pseudomonadota bacterium]
MRAFALLSLLLWPGALLATTAPEFERALRLPELAVTLAAEAARTASQIDDDMLGGEGGSVFATQIAHINDPARLAAEIADGLAASLPKDVARPVLSFLQSPQGQNIIALELSARQAFLDPEVEAFARGAAEDSPFAAQIDQLIASGDMITENRETAALTTAAFYRGLRAGGALDLSDAQIDDLAQEQASGADADTRGWLEGFFSLAYSPLDPGEIDVLVAFWETDEGIAFSRALYDVYDAAYIDRWFAMGRAAALFMVAEDI